MNPDSLPKLSEVMDNYNLHFKKFSLAMFHPITTEYNNLSKYASDFIDALIKSNKNYQAIVMDIYTTTKKPIFVPNSKF